MSEPAPGNSLFSRGSWAEARRVADILRSETVAGVLLIIAAAVAMVWANTPWSSSYFWLRELRVGPAALHLNLTLADWAADGLLAIFFFLAGLELKREFVCGDLRDPRRAAIPVAAAIGGMIVPAIVFVAFNAGSGTTDGWAIPTATDIAFSLAVLAVISTHLPSAVRTFLLALAIVDDLLAIVVIAIFYTEDLQLVVPGAGPGADRRFRLAVAAAGGAVVVCGPVGTGGVGVGALLRRARHRRRGAAGVRRAGEGQCAARRTPWRCREWQMGSNTECARCRPGSPCRCSRSSRPVLRSADWPRSAIRWAKPVTLGIILGLVLGKPLGVLLGIWVVGKALRSGMDSDVNWSDAFGAALLCGIGFTVSLLISELAFETDPELIDQARIGVLCGSLVAAALAALVLRRRNRHYRELEELEAQDTDADGVPDVYEGR